MVWRRRRLGREADGDEDSVPDSSRLEAKVPLFRRPAPPRCYTSTGASLWRMQGCAVRSGHAAMTRSRGIAPFPAGPARLPRASTFGRATGAGMDARLWNRPPPRLQLAPSNRVMARACGTDGSLIRLVAGTASSRWKFHLAEDAEGRAPVRRPCRPGPVRVRWPDGPAPGNAVGRSVPGRCQTGVGPECQASAGLVVRHSVTGPWPGHGTWSDQAAFLRRLRRARRAVGSSSTLAGSGIAGTSGSMITSPSIVRPAMARPECQIVSFQFTTPKVKE